MVTVVQLAERPICNRDVAGPNPVGHPTKNYPNSMAASAAIFFMYATQHIVSNFIELSRDTYQERERLVSPFQVAIIGLHAPEEIRQNKR